MRQPVPPLTIAPGRSAGRAVVAILTAAGSGTRLGAGCPKALVDVAGRSLLQRAASGLLGSGVVDHLVVTTPAGDLDRFTEHLRGSNLLPGSVRVVAGSEASRQASVALGLSAARQDRPEADVVLVHDAARPLTPPAVVHRVVAAVRRGCGAVVPALPVTDTVKEVAPDGAGDERVVTTPDRTRLRAVQTPQGFAVAALVAAHEGGARRAGDEALAASDDAALVEALGGEVTVVAGDPLAFKVTTPLDLALAEVLAGRRGRVGGPPAP